MAPRSKPNVTINPDDDPKVKDAKGRYIEQCDLVEILRKEWIKLNKPATQMGGATGRTIQVHVLVKELQSAEKQADVLLRTIDDLEAPRRPIGRPPGSGSAPDRRSPGSGRIKKIV